MKTNEERKAIIDRFLEERKNGVSLREFSNKENIPYYTLRDWFRDARYNRDYWEIKEEYKTK